MRYTLRTTLASILLTLVISLLSYSLEAQYAIITGMVQDGHDNSPISGVHISYLNASNGVTSNNDGNFQLRIDKVGLVDSITFSHVAYDTKKFSLRDLLKYDLVVELNAAIYETPNVTITQLDGEQLVSRALGNIEKYFHHEDHYIGGFYREKTIHLGRSELIYLAEGQLNVYKSKYSNHPEYPPYRDWKAPQDQVQLVQGEIVTQSSTYEAYNMLQYIPEIANGPTVPLSLDFYKSSKAFLSEGEFEYYDYKLKGYEQIGGANYYLISFEPKNDLIFTRGIFYYNADKEIVTGVKYHFTENGLNAYNKTNLIDLISRTFDVTYKERGGKYTLDHTLVKNVFSHKILGDQIYNELEFITTSVETDNILPIPLNKELSQDHDLKHFIRLGPVPIWGSISLIPREKEISAMLIPEREKAAPPKHETNSSKVNFLPLEQNLNNAPKKNKISLLISSAKWCSPCIKMKDQVFNDKETIDLLNEHFYITILDYDIPQDKSTARKYNMNGLPSYLALTENDVELGRSFGYRSISIFYEDLKFFIKKKEAIPTLYDKNLINDIQELRESYSKSKKEQKKKEKKISKKINKGKLTQKEIAFVLNTTQINDWESRSFKNLITHKDDFLLHYSPKQYTDKLLQAIITIHYNQGKKHNYNKGKIDPGQVSKMLSKYLSYDYDIVHSRFMAEYHQNVTLDLQASNQSWLKYFRVIPSEEFKSYDMDLFNFISRTTDIKTLAKLKTIILEHNIDSPLIKDHIMQIDFLLEGEKATPRTKVIQQEADKTFISRY